VQRAARAFLTQFLVERIGDGQRVGVELDDGVDRRATLVDFVDAAMERAVYLPDFIPACRSVTVTSSNSKGFTATGDGEADSD
jgi:hypothetical protein